MRFRKVLVQMKVPVQRLGQVPEGSGADNQVRIRKVPVQGLGERFRKVSVQRLGQVPERFGAHTQVRFRKIPVQR